MSEYLLVMTTVPDEGKGKEIAKRLVEGRLAACVTVSAAAHSSYWWEDKIVQDREFILFIKTRAGLFEALEAALKEIHPYAVPEIIALPIVRGSKPYLDWVARETKKG